MPYYEPITMNFLTRILIATICLFSTINLCFGQSKADNHILYAFDSIFRTALNSPAYVVASKEDIQTLKESLKVERDSLYIKLQNQEKELSQLKSAAPIVAQPSIVQEIPQPVEAPASNYLIFQLIIALLVGAVIYFFMKDFSVKKEVKEAKDSYKNLVTEFEDHKKKAIERERKLMRKVIDLQNDLEEKSSPMA